MNNSARITSDDLRNSLKLKSFTAKNDLFSKHPHAGKFFVKKGFDLSKIREHSAKLISAGALAGALLLNSPTEQMKLLPTPNELTDKFNKPDANTDSSNKGKLLSGILSSVLPERVRPLERNEEKLLEQLFKDVIGVNVKATLEGEHLNTTYGFIGAEQHLRRYPGDVSDPDLPQEIQNSGIAPGLGAWGYFAGSRQEFKSDALEREKWYAVVQTLYLPDWGGRQPFLKDWYKYRKVLIVNTDNGKAVVCDIADSGPAVWTGKQYGGSPEVMDALGGAKYKKGKVLVFFVDDPENNVALGPVEYGNKR
jgi:hypothetical protein